MSHTEQHLSVVFLVTRRDRVFQINAIPIDCLLNGMPLVRFDGNAEEKMLSAAGQRSLRLNVFAGGYPGQKGVRPQRCFHIVAGSLSGKNRKHFRKLHVGLAKDFWKIRVWEGQRKLA